MKCKVPHTASHDELGSLLDEYSLELRAIGAWKGDLAAARDAQLRDWRTGFGGDRREITLYEPHGCEVCGGTGYKGRVDLHELPLGTDTIKRNIQEHKSVSVMLATALGEGMRTLKQDGIEEVLMGITDMR